MSLSLRELGLALPGPSTAPAEILAAHARAGQELVRTEDLTFDGQVKIEKGDVVTSIEEAPNMPLARIITYVSGKEETLGIAANALRFENAD